MLSTDLPYAPAFSLIDNHTRKKNLLYKGFYTDVYSNNIAK